MTSWRWFFLFQLKICTTYSTSDGQMTHTLAYFNISYILCAPIFVGQLRLLIVFNRNVIAHWLFINHDKFAFANKYWIAIICLCNIIIWIQKLGKTDFCFWQKFFRAIQVAIVSAYKVSMKNDFWFILRALMQLRRNFIVFEVENGKVQGGMERARTKSSTIKYI